MRQRTIPQLRRGKAKRDPKKRFIIFCEGRNTEPDYFRKLGQRLKNVLVALELIAPAGVPLTIATRASQKSQELGLVGGGKRKELFERDEVWAVFDRDEHPNYDEAIALCERNRVGVARSNPCFEVWLLYHLTDFNRPDDRRAVQRELDRLHSKYDAGSGKIADCDGLLEYLEQAEQRAETGLSARVSEGRAFGPPSSTVGRLTKAIRLAATNTR